MGIIGIWVYGHLGIWVYEYIIIKIIIIIFLAKNYLQVEVLQVLYNNARPIGSKGVQARYKLSSNVVKSTINQYRK